jgi:hypothetical protein
MTDCKYIQGNNGTICKFYHHLENHKQQSLTPGHLADFYNNKGFNKDSEQCQLHETLTLKVLWELNPQP